MSEIWAAAVEGFTGAFRVAWRAVTFNYFEVRRLRRDCGEAYMVVGCMLSPAVPHTDDDLVRVLDNLSAAANDMPRPHDDLLPWPATNSSPAT